MIWNKKKALEIKIKDSWGKVKDEPLDFNKIAYYHQNRKDVPAIQVISEQTIKDIDFYHLFEFVDRSYSRIGQQCLYSKLLTILKAYKFDEQEVLISIFDKNENKRFETQKILSRLNQEEAYNIVRLFLEVFVKRPGYFPFLVMMSLSGFFSLILVLVFPFLWLLIIGVFCVNMLLHYIHKKHTDMYSDSIPQLYILINCVKDLINLKLPIHTVTDTNRALKSLEKVKSPMKIFKLEAIRRTEAIFKGFVAESIYVIFEYLKIQLLLEPLIVFNTLKQLEKKRGDIKQLYKYIGTIDNAMSIASLRTSLNQYCIPEFKTDIDTITIKGIYHPLVKDCISNSIKLKRKSILLTGSNMSGKTTFIRSIAINMLFSQTINTCFATRIVIPPMKIYSAIRISDDVLMGKSYYFEEVQIINKMIKASRSGIRTLFLLDEIFKGTNTIERIAAGKAVLSHLCRNGNIVFVSTHDIELTDLLKGEFDLHHFTEDVRNNTIHFDYKLKEGRLRTRNAIKILEINGYPKEVVSEAKTILNKVINLTFNNLNL